jgi:hypothetical protein
MKELERRLRRLEIPAVDGRWLVVKQYLGMTRDEALLLRFGPGGPPPHTNTILISGGLPDEIDGEPLDYYWAEKRGTPGYAAIWSRLARQWRET